jgi:hypothetical protein
LEYIYTQSPIKVVPSHCISTYAPACSMSISELVFNVCYVWIRGWCLCQIEPRSLIEYTNHNADPGALCVTCYQNTFFAKPSHNKAQVPNHCLYGLLLALLDPVCAACSAAAGGGPRGGVYSGDGSPGAGWLPVGPVLDWDGSTLVAPAGG